MQISLKDSNECEATINADEGGDRHIYKELN